MRILLLQTNFLCHLLKIVTVLSGIVTFSDPIHLSAGGIIFVDTHHLLKPATASIDTGSPEFRQVKVRSDTVMLSN